MATVFIQLIQFAALQFFAEDADFFSVLEAFYQTFETDTAAGTRVDTVCIAGCPGAETGVAQRIFCPAVDCPTQVTVVTSGNGVQDRPGGFCRVGEGEVFGNASEQQV